MERDYIDKDSNMFLRKAHVLHQEGNKFIVMLYSYSDKNNFNDVQFCCVSNSFNISNNKFIENITKDIKLIVDDYGFYTDTIPYVPFIVNKDILEIMRTQLNEHLGCEIEEGKYPNEISIVSKEELRNLLHSLAKLNNADRQM